MWQNEMPHALQVLYRSLYCTYFTNKEMLFISNF
jgi:hypothetical protein